MNVKTSIFTTVLVFTSFFVTADSRVSNWTPYQEGLRVRVAVSAVTPEHFVFYAEKNSNYVNNLVMPPIDQRFKCALSDTNGNQIQKTAQGREQGSILETRMNRHRWISSQIRFPPDGSASMQIGFVIRHELFKVEIEGDYELSVTVRLLKENGKSLSPEFYPPVKLKIHLKPMTQGLPVKQGERRTPDKSGR